MPIKTTPFKGVRFNRPATRTQQATAASINVYDASPDYAAWLNKAMPGYMTVPNAPRHDRVWSWFAALEPGIRPRPIVEIWPRGGGKSSTIEVGTTWVGAVRQTRMFGLYVCRTQEQANAHISAIAALLERLGVGRAVNKYNHSKGWTQTILRTDSGFNLVAFGLDAAMRGLKLDQYRPDLIIFDDIDDRHDSVEATKKKIATLTETILPAGSTDCAIVFVQNRIIDTGIAAQLADGTADYLLDRLPVQQEPAVQGLEYDRVVGDDGELRIKVTGGIPTWEGQSLEVCESQMNTWGRRAFLREAQHRTRNDEDGLWDKKRDIEPYRVSVCPPLARVAVFVDPSNTASGDEAGIMAGGVDARGHAYLLQDRSLRGTPRAWASEAVALYSAVRAQIMAAEDNSGGEMVAETIGHVEGSPAVKLVHVSRSKTDRALPVQDLSEDGRIHFVGSFELLEAELCSWQVGDDSPNRMDAFVGLMTELLIKPGTAEKPKAGAVRVAAAVYQPGGSAASGGRRLPPKIGQK